MFCHVSRLFAVAAMSLPLFLTSACSHHAQSGATSSELERIDWTSFTTMDIPGLKSSNLDELNRKEGFAFVLPSYLPQGMSRTFILSSQIDSTIATSGSVTLRPNDGSAPEIEIDEYLRPAWQPVTTGYSDDYDVHSISGALVGCLTEVPGQSWPNPTPNGGQAAKWSCEWDKGELSFRVVFGWHIEDGSSSEISPERRDEALKVVTSMIEDPYTP